ncbi:hypothetical protein SAMN05421539_11165 [Jannaschia seohaensis]|uniref:Uncharacterized protein n=1 Tax=Jannaschia seohaensis TaxID=475081 RepID=A0A2Y9B4H8_9RHOB|nr:hypothetical protein BCF38_11165 [Jannaschia seohaensis]SSA49897.1 hypothetical protein SAMN05421539_11165 [Jannaschia seohaensis]
MRRLGLPLRATLPASGCISERAGATAFGPVVGMTPGPLVCAETRILDAIPADMKNPMAADALASRKGADRAQDAGARGNRRPVPCPSVTLPPVTGPRVTRPDGSPSGAPDANVLGGPALIGGSGSGARPDLAAYRPDMPRDAAPSALASLCFLPPRSIDGRPPIASPSAAASRAPAPEL